MKNVMLLLCLIVVFVFSSPSHALLITPDSDFLKTGNETSQSDINTIISPLIGASTFLYKSDVGTPPVESGLIDNYETIFSNGNSNALIEYVGGDYITSAYLLVKDGNHTPAWYLFDLTTIWNGIETIELQNFWPEGGAISHVSLYGVETVPEPTSMLLLGFGLIGLSAVSRKLGLFRGENFPYL